MRPVSLARMGACRWRSWSRELHTMVIFFGVGVGVGVACRVGVGVVRWLGQG